MTDKHVIFIGAPSKSEVPEMSDPNPYQSPVTPVVVVEDQPEAAARLYEAAQVLAKTKPWVRFLSVLGFLMSALSIFGLIGLSVFANGPGAAGLTFSAIMISIVTMILMYFIPSLLMWKYANRISSFLNQQNPATLATAITAQKALWMYVGVAGAILTVYSVGARLMSALG